MEQRGFLKERYELFENRICEKRKTKMIFSKRELITTFSMKEQAQVRELLHNNDIKYKCKIINRNSASPFGSSRARTGTLGQNMELTYEYIFSVNKKDYEKAKSILGRLKN